MDTGETARRSLEQGAERVRLVRIEGGTSIQAEELVVRESSLTVVLDRQELATMLCLPADLKALAVGFLFSEGFIKRRDDIAKIAVDNRKSIVRVETREGRGPDPEVLRRRIITSGCGKGASFYRLADAAAGIAINSDFTMAAADVQALVDEFQQGSDLHRVTRGVHSAALCGSREIIMFADDVGRHNTIDRIVGRCLLENVPAASHGLIFSGRISSEMLLKAARAGIPVVISVASPTNVAVRMAREMGMTVVGRARGTSLNVYSGDWRIVIDEGQPSRAD